MSTHSDDIKKLMRAMGNKRLKGHKLVKAMWYMNKKWPNCGWDREAGNLELLLDERKIKRL